MKTGPGVGATTREGQASGAEGTIPPVGRKGALLPIRIEDAHRFADLTRSGARKASEIVLLILRKLQPSRCVKKGRGLGGCGRVQGRCRSRARQNGTAIRALWLAKEAAKRENQTNSAYAATKKKPRGLASGAKSVIPRGERCDTTGADDIQQWADCIPPPV